MALARKAGKNGKLGSFFISGATGAFTTETAPIGDLEPSSPMRPTRANRVWPTSRLNGVDEHSHGAVGVFSRNDDLELNASLNDEGIGLVFTLCAVNRIHRNADLSNFVVGRRRLGRNPLTPKGRSLGYRWMSGLRLVTVAFTSFSRNAPRFPLPRLQPC